MNLDKLKSDIANNEICVLVNGQPETVNFKQWCRDVAMDYPYQMYYTVMPNDIHSMIKLISNGHEFDTNLYKYIYSQLDY